MILIYETYSSKNKQDYFLAHLRVDRENPTFFALKSMLFCVKD